MTGHDERELVGRRPHDEANEVIVLMDRSSCAADPETTAPPRWPGKRRGGRRHRFPVAREGRPSRIGRPRCLLHRGGPIVTNSQTLLPVSAAADGSTTVTGDVDGWA